ncbi:hypothetical protein CPB85DRAFT_1256002 [Mucidula mucida]|nr:hypothetical protein CPB85DRAFT_1256002 [Mucidula mucida]
MRLLVGFWGELKGTILETAIHVRGGGRKHGGQLLKDLSRLGNVSNCASQKHKGNVERYDQQLIVSAHALFARRKELNSKQTITNAKRAALDAKLATVPHSH